MASDADSAKEAANRSTTAVIGGSLPPWRPIRHLPILGLHLAC